MRFACSRRTPAPHSFFDSSDSSLTCTPLPLDAEFIMIMRILLALLVAMTLYVPAALADDFIAVGPISNGSAIFELLLSNDSSRVSFVVSVSFPPPVLYRSHGM